MSGLKRFFGVSIATGIIMAAHFTGCVKPPVDLPPVTISNEISFTENPHAPWQVGFTSADTPDVYMFSYCLYADTDAAINVWHPSAGAAGYYPYTGQNKTNVLQMDATHSWAARPGEIVMEASDAGEYAMLQFTAPSAGSYKMQVRFEGIHAGLSSTDVHVLLNNAHLFDDVIEGYGGDSTFHTITGAHPSCTYSDTLQLQKDNVITFAVGYGSNKNHFNDTTGLIIEIKKD